MWTDRVYVGLDRPKEEGAPMHPDDMRWQHGPECIICWANYLKQLNAYLEWEELKKK